MAPDRTARDGRRGWLERIRSSGTGRLAAAFGESNASNYAAGLAYTAFLSMFPLILGILSIAGFVIHDASLEARLREAVVSAFPSSARDEILRALQGVKQNAGLLGILSLLGLIFSGSSLFGSMEFALDRIFGLKPRGFTGQKLMALGMMLVFVFGLIVAVGANSLGGLLPGRAALGSLLGALVGALVMVALLLAIYRIVPNGRFRLAEVWPGAVVAGIGIEILNLAFPLYAVATHDFNTYGRQFALFFLISAWLGLLCQLLLLGAVLNKLLLDQRPALAGQTAESGKAPEPRSGRRRLLGMLVWLVVLWLVLVRPFRETRRAAF